MNSDTVSAQNIESLKYSIFLICSVITLTSITGSNSEGLDFLIKNSGVSLTK